MSVLPKTAVIVVHGIGEQRPLDTLRNFVGLRSTKRGRGILGRPDEGDENDPLRADRDHVFVGPDSITKSTYSRRLSFDQTHLVPAVATLPPKLERANYGQITHFYEYYWAFRFRDTAWRHLTPLIGRLVLGTRRGETYPGAVRGPDGVLRWGIWTSLIALFVLFVCLSKETVQRAQDVSGTETAGFLGHNWPWIWPLLLLAACGLVLTGVAQFGGLLTFLRALTVVAMGLVATALAALWQSDILARSAEQTSTSRLVGLLVSLGASVVVPALSGFPLKQLGDASRYMSSHPDNVSEREDIRSELIAMLRALESRLDPVTKRPLYDRVVLVGHSLGSVIAYDALTAYWSEFNQSLYFPDRGEESVEKPLGLLVKDLEEQSRTPTTAKAWTSRQRRLQTALSAGVRWRQGRLWKVPRRWIVTDLVTVGSPLCHAEVLLATGKTEWEELKETRLVSTSPPQPQTTQPAAELHRFRYRDWRGRYYVTKLHHQALFAVTSWTNVHFTNDLVGGPLALRFGSGVTDVTIQTGASTILEARRFSHTSYWGVASPFFGSDTAVNESRQALRDIILRQLPVLVLSGGKAQLGEFRAAVLGSDIALRDYSDDPMAGTTSSQMIRLRILRVSTTYEPPRQWTWLGFEPLVALDDLGTIFEMAEAAGLTSRLSDGYRSSPAPPAATEAVQVGADDSEDLDEPPADLDPQAAEPDEEEEIATPAGPYPARDQPGGSARR